MASLLIRNLDEQTKARLRVRAARNGHSLEVEARAILKNVLRGEPSRGEHLVDRIIRRMRPLGGVDLPPISRDEFPEPLVFDE